MGQCSCCKTGTWTVFSAVNIIIQPASKCTYISFHFLYVLFSIGNRWRKCLWAGFGTKSFCGLTSCSADPPAALKTLCWDWFLRCREIYNRKTQVKHWTAATVDGGSSGPTYRLLRKVGLLQHHGLGLTEALSWALGGFNAHLHGSLRHCAAWRD